MISLIKNSLKAAEEIDALLKEVENNCNKTVSTVRANGVLLEELKNNNYKHLSRVN